MQQNPQMVMVPNQGLDVSAMGLNNGGWNSGIDMNYANTPIFAVLEVPEPPVIDTEILSGKGSPLGTLLPETTSNKEEAPVLDCPQMAQPPQAPGVGVENPDVEFDESDPAFALFADLPTSVPELSEERFEGLASDKSAPVFEIIVENESKATAQRFAQFCRSMEASFQRVSMFTSHLS